MEKTKDHLGWIDGLRAIAVLMVAVFHTQKYYLHQGRLTKFYMLGFHGVDLFFVISGLCLSYPILLSRLKDQKTVFDVKRFWLRRATRILPPYYIAAIILIAVSLLYKPFFLEAGRVLPTIKADIRMFFFIDRAGMPANGSFWTLPIEARWYIIFPVVIGLWVASRRGYLLAVAALLFLIPDTTAASIDLAVLPEFMLGVVVADSVLRPERYAIFKPWLIPVTLISLVLAFTLNPSKSFGYNAYPSWLVACFLFVMTCASYRAIQRALAFAPLVWIGVASYSIYLVHEPIVMFLERAHHVSPIVAFAVAMAFGGAFWYLIERPLASPSARQTITKGARSAFAWLRSLPTYWTRIATGA